MGGYGYHYYPRLPVGYRTVTYGANRYYLYDNVYYTPYVYQGATVYVTVPPPF